MTSNPRVLPIQGRFCIVFQRPDGHLLSWIQDISGRKLKRDLVARDEVTFATREEAQTEIRSVVVPYVRSEKPDYEDLIVGW